jgi:hypothetical protein
VGRRRLGARFRVSSSGPGEAFLDNPSGEREKQARLGLDKLEKRVPFEQGVEAGHVVHHANVPENRILVLDHAIEVGAVLEESDWFAKG